MSRSDKLALLFSLLAVGAAALVADRVFERLPHLEDEIAYVWQARAIAGGRLSVPSPVEPKRFLVPFVVDYNGLRFGKYPPGWPAVLSLGERLGGREWVNSLLAGASVWLTYRLGKRLFGEIAGLLAAGLTLTSPFFLINAGSLLAHPLGLVLSLAFCLAWLDAFGDRSARGGWHQAIAAGMILGLFALTRPFTALGVALPFGLHGLILLVRGPALKRLQVVTVAAIALGLGSLIFLWQAAVTGDPLLNPYTLWWSYDRVGLGPGVGRGAKGHTLRAAWINTLFSLRAGNHDLFGWPYAGWLFFLPGLIAIRKNWKTWLSVSVVLSLLAIHFLYWIGAWLFGPRYQFEGLYSLTLLSAAGIAWLAGWPHSPSQTYQSRFGWRTIRPLGVTFLVGCLLAMNLIFYLPARLETMHGLYGISRERLHAFEAASVDALTPAVVIVHAGHWTQYGALLDLQDPFLTSSFVFTFGTKVGLEQTLTASFPDRTLYHYYPDEPERLYSTPR